MNKWFLPYDVFERHRKAGSLIESSDTVADIGGELNHLGQFCSYRKIVVANLQSGDVIIKKDKLPFGKNSFDVVCAIDVLEHIPKSKRGDFIARLFEVSSKRVILSFPIGGKKHIEYEKETLKWLKNKGVDVFYLEEHIKNGLPTFDEIEELAKDYIRLAHVISYNYQYKIFYSGNLTINKYLFRIFMFDPNIKYIRKLIYHLKLIFNFLTNNFFYYLLADKNYSDSVNRAYLIIDKK